jgi:hypothetical protein
MVIWLLDCSNGCATKVTLSKEREEEMNRYLDEEKGDMWDYITMHADDFGINANSTSFMASENDNLYEVDF